MFCPKCGKQLKDGAKFCSGCGAKIQATTPKVESVQQPVPEKAEAEKEDIAAVETASAETVKEETTKVDIPIMQVPPVPEMADKPEPKPVQQELVQHKKLETHNEFLKTQPQPDSKTKARVKEEAPTKKSGIGITTILTIVFILLAAGITAGSFGYTNIIKEPLETIALETESAEEDEVAEDTDSEAADAEETDEADAAEATEETEAASK